MTLEERIKLLEDRVALLEAGKKPATPNGTLVRGQHNGKTHADVVERYPDYVVWNADKGYASGLGFSDEQIAAARKAVAAGPRAAEAPSQKTKSGPPW